MVAHYSILAWRIPWTEGAHHPGAHIRNSAVSSDTDGRDVSDPRGTATEKVPGRGGGGQTVQARKYRQRNICALVPPTEEEKKGLYQHLLKRENQTLKKKKVLPK